MNVLDVTREEAVARARSMVGQGVYELGAGGRDPAAKTPFVGGRCDCSGFIAWCLKYDRKVNLFHLEWMNTDAMVLDALTHSDMFYETTTPAAGDIVVYPGIDLNRDGRRDRIGHVGIIVEAGRNVAKCRVVHCQASKSPAVIETNGAPWVGRSTFRGQMNSRWKSRVLSYEGYLTSAT